MSDDIVAKYCRRHASLVTVAVFVFYSTDARTDCNYLVCYAPSDS